MQVVHDLQAFLEPLMAFGGCLEALEAAHTERSAPAQQAAQRWKQALNAARSAVNAIDADRRIGAATDLGPIEWPLPSVDQDAWLTEIALDESGAALPRLGDAPLETCLGAARAVDAAVLALGTAEDTLLARLAGPLRQLQQEADAFGERIDTCPVCNIQDVAWLEELTASLATLPAAEVQRQLTGAALGELNRKTQDDLMPLLAVLDAADLTDEQRAARTELRMRGEAMLAALRSAGSSRSRSSANRPQVCFQCWLQMAHQPQSRRACARPRMRGSGGLQGARRCSRSSTPGQQTGCSPLNKTNGRPPRRTCARCRRLCARNALQLWATQRRRRLSNSCPTPAWTSPDLPYLRERRASRYPTPLDSL